MMPAGFDFCPVCGQDQRMRMRRPSTEQMHVSRFAPIAAVASAPVGPSPPAAPAPAPGSSVDRTVPSPGLGEMSRPAVPSFAPPPSAGGTPAPREDSLIAAVADANTMEPRDGMPAVAASEVSESDRTQPNPQRSTPEVGDDDRTTPHPRMHQQHAPSKPVAISPVRATLAPATQPDRPGGFSGGPGHGPLPSVNRAERGTMSGRATDQHGSVGQPQRGQGGPRLVLVARDGSEGEAFPLQQDQLTIGRTHGDLLFPEDPFLSPMHVRLQRTANGMGIFDAGSTNGVYLRIRGSAPVYPGDQFMIGHQMLRLENIDTQVQERPPAIDGTRVFGTPLQPAWGCVRQVGRGGIVGDKYYLRGSQVVFGREGGDLLFPNDPFVSREHARLRLELHGQSMAVFLEDLESANGSYIRIRGSAEMVSLDTFRVGDQILRLRLD